MSAPIALQLYTLREEAEKDFEAVVRRVADIGYVGVEPAGFPGTTPEGAAKLFEELGLEVCSAHLPLPVGDAREQSLDAAAALGIERLVAGRGPDSFNTVDGIKAARDQFNEAAEICRQAGMSFGMHNHWWEFLEVDGTLAYKHLLEGLDEGIFFEIDTYWVQVAGVDPAAVLAELGPRAPLIHLKDGPCTREADMQALGEGITDFDSIVAVADSVDWWIVELDRCATDMMKAVVKSYGFVTRRGYGRGNK